MHGMKLLLSFSGAFLLGVLVLEMLPEIYVASPQTAGFWVLGGILVQNILEFFSKGAEHGHIHLQPKQKLPWVLVASLCVHALLEGIPLAENKALLWAVSLHKFPIALVVGLLLFQAHATSLQKTLAMLVFAIMTPLGSVFSTQLPLDSLNLYLAPFVVGLLFHISTTILFESAEGHTFNRHKFLSILLGIGLAALV